ncbi:hypothetical protein M0813_10591 [Anaeramoeba flamelloides]|uniref:Uncharacterized protein n=1 Tax=Anaeramoeba flamelloides TaxID=1746091 RepID=A0ABQ8X2D8_9EUKA|nr:hypothetical protein M0813_10591 [Anaeramoeba flamelloides]
MSKDLLMSTLVCGFLGLVFSIIIADSLIEITYFRIFSILFAITFLALSLVFLMYFIELRKTATKFRSNCLLFVTIYIFIAGIFCWFPDQGWWFKASHSLRIFSYILIAIALSFVLVFVAMEIYSSPKFDKLFKRKDGPSMLLPRILKSQIILIIALAIFVGLIVGSIVGVVDIEDSEDAYYDLKFSIVRALFVGLAVGLLAGSLAYTMRSKEKKEISQKYAPLETKKAIASYTTVSQEDELL